MKRRKEEEERINEQRRQEKEARRQAIELKRAQELLALQKKYSRFSRVDPKPVVKAPEENAKDPDQTALSNELKETLNSKTSYDTTPKSKSANETN